MDAWRRNDYGSDTLAQNSKRPCVELLDASLAHLA